VEMIEVSNMNSSRRQRNMPCVKSDNNPKLRLNLTVLRHVETPEESARVARGQTAIDVRCVRPAVRDWEPDQSGLAPC
jgi:hypothetical protein